MLSIEECRKIIGLSEDELSNDELENIRYSLYQMSQVIVNNYFEVKNNESNNLHKSFNWRTSQARI